MPRHRRRLEAELLEHRHCPTAFPGAEGFGAVANGGRGGAVYHVTNLNDSGIGSLRDAVSASNRTIVFDVSGNITLSNRITASGSNLTLAGQTSPGQGIAVIGAGFFVAGDNVIIRDMRFREGDLRAGADDSLDINSSASTVILDHLSVEFGEDENLTNYGSNTTVQNTIVAYGLKDHSAGGLTGGTNHSYHHNLYAHNHTRNIKDNSGLVDFTSNVVYDYGFAFIAADSTGGSYHVNFRGNYYTRPENGSRDLIVEQGQTDGNGVPTVGLYLGKTATGDANFTDANADGLLNGYDRGTASVSGSYTYMTTPWAVPAVTLDTPLAAYNKVVANVGARPQDRDEDDAILLYELTTQTGRQISSQSGMKTWWQAGQPVPSNNGYGAPAGGTKLADSDGDGMPDDFETYYGLNPNDAGDRNGDFDGTGYTNLEKYINGLMDGSYGFTPAPWHIGDVNAAASDARYDPTDGSFALRATGGGIANAGDRLTLVTQPVAGDLTLSTKVTGQPYSPNAYAEAGLTIRSSNAPLSAFASVAATPGGRIFFRYRGTDGGTNTYSVVYANTPVSLKLTRAGNVFAAFYSTDDVTWTQIGSNRTLAIAATAQAGLMASGGSATDETTGEFTDVSLIPAGWTTTDINQALPSTTTDAPAIDTWSLRTSGGASGAVGDALALVSQPFTGDGAATAYIGALGANTGGAGVTFRNSTSPTAAFARVEVTSDGHVFFNWRGLDGGTTSYFYAYTTAPTWVRLLRVGNVFSGFFSANGSTWTQIGSSRTLGLAASTLAGLAVRGASSTARSAAVTVTSLSIVPLPKVGAMTVNGGAVQRSRVTTISVAFDAALNEALLATAFTLTRTDNAVVGSIAVAATTTSGRTTAVLGFSGANTEGDSLADGVWVLKIDHLKVQTTTGLGMVADYSTPTAGGSRIARLFGDSDGDGDVDLSDLSPFRQTFGTVSADLNFNAAFDSDGDGDVDLTDLSQFRTRFGAILP